MNRHNKPTRPRTPLLIMLLAVAAFVAAVSFINVEVTTRVMEVVATTALVIVSGAQRIFIR